MNLCLKPFRLRLHFSAILRCRCVTNDQQDPPFNSSKSWSEKREYDRFGHTHWRPKKRLTRYQMDHLKELHQTSPTEWTMTKLSKKFLISHSAVKRILRSKFEPSEEIAHRQDKKALEKKEIRKKAITENKNNEKNEQTASKHEKKALEDKIGKRTMKNEQKLTS